MIETRLLKSMLNLVIIRGFTYVFPLISLPLLTKTLGVDGFGALSIFISIQQYGILIVEFGFNLTGTRDISSENDDQRSAEIFWTIIFARLMLSILVLILMLSIAILFDISISTMLVGWLATLGVAVYPYFYLLAKEKTTVITIITFISRLSSIAVLCLFVKSKEDGLIALLVYSMNWLIPGVIGIVYVFFKLKIKVHRPSYLNLKNTFKSSFDLFITNLFTSAYGPLNIIVLGYFTNSYWVGVFSAADKIRAAFQGVLQPISQALYARVSQLISDNSFNSYWGFSRNLIFCASMLICIILISFGASIISNFLGEAYIAAYSSLIVLSISIVFVGFGMSYGQNYFVITKQTLFLRKVYIFASLLHLVHMPLFIYFFQQLGAAISVLITELVVSSAFIIKKHDFRVKKYA